MSLVAVQNLSCTQGVKPLFDSISFAIAPGDKIALIGVNGCGKSTLLSELRESVDTANPAIILKQGLKVTYLSQVPVFDPADSILDHLFGSDTAVARAIREYELCLDRMRTDTSDELSRQFESAMAQMELLDAWTYESRVTSILNELHIHQLTQLMGTLSGGMLKKIELARLFFEDTDLIIMDEPTNHLDIETIDWLETTLKRMNVALLMVTHDRYFLDKVCTHIFEIDQQSLFAYRGDYATFLEQRAQRYSIQEKAEDSIKSVLRVELEWLKRGPKARSTKQKARKDRIAEMMDRKVFSKDNVLELGVATRRLGNKILALKDISKSFQGRSVLDHFSYEFKHGEKIGILGPNGAGKTTLLNVIAQRISPDSGEVDCGINTVFGYFEQNSDFFDPDQTIYEHVKEVGDQITLHDGTQLSAAKLLERFLFPSSSLSTAIGKLSGGERRRLHLVCMLLGNPNFLLFDEPTNDLDVVTLSVLESFLINFQGCVVIISHDRYFMDRVVDHLLIFNGDGTTSHFWGGYTDYADTLAEIAKAQTRSSEPIALPLLPIVKKKQLSFKEQQELKRLEAEIEALEAEKVELAALFSSGEGSSVAYQAAGKRLKDIEFDLQDRLPRWEVLAEMA